MAILALVSVAAFGVSVLPVSNLSRGMRGVGYSVFAGWNSEPFEVEIIDVMRGASPDDTLILARLSGANLENSGVIAGMSGSPVYVDGRLIGAVAYAWSFAREALCAITPAELMLRSLPPPTVERRRSPGRRRSLFGDRPLFLWGGLSNDEFAAFLGTNALPQPAQFFPLATPSMARADSPREIRPGDAVAVHLVDGDVQIQAIGTATAVSNDRVYMFGHPLFQAGNFEAPFSRAYIYGVVPSYTVSFKLGSAGQEIGSIVHDGAFAIEGRLGRKADMISVTTTVIGDGRSNTYRYRVIRSPLYQSYFLLSGLFALLQSSLGAQDRHVFTLSTEATVVHRMRTNILRHNVVSFWDNDSATFSHMAGELARFFSVAGNWIKEAVRLENLNIRVHKQPAGSMGFVERVWVDKPAYFPGETMQVVVMLRDENGRQHRKVLPLVIPPRFSAGKYHLVVGDYQGIVRYMENELKVWANMRAYDDVIEYYREREHQPLSPTSLWAALLEPVSSLQTSQGMLPAFPKRYWDRLEVGSRFGKERRTFSPIFARRDIPFSLFYDIAVVPVVVKLTNARSEQ